VGDSLQDVDLLRRRVLNVVGHELRTPVTTLSGLATALERCTDEGERRELLAAVARNANRLERLVDDLLLAAGISTVVPVEEPEAIDLVAAARSQWTGRADAISGSAIGLARRTSVRRILGAVLDNAITHGEAPFTIVGSVVGDRAVLDVSNGGPPLSDAELETAAELFFRGERAVTTHPGLGVGLAMARTLIEADGGSLGLHPRDAGGVIARIELPRP
jgi:two-component system sensor histidine kinase KdpD